MRPIPSNKKSSYEGNAHRSSKNSGSRGYTSGYGGNNGLVLESSGPEGKIRGTARQIADRYTSLARDALSSGDYVAAEGFSQYAEHYLRILAEAGGGTHFSEHRRHNRRPEGGEETQQLSSPQTTFSPPVTQSGDALGGVTPPPPVSELSESSSLFSLSPSQGEDAAPSVESFSAAKKSIKRPRRYKKPSLSPEE